jgi:hypothetical protein
MKGQANTLERKKKKQYCNQQKNSGIEPYISRKKVCNNDPSLKPSNVSRETNKKEKRY